MTELLRLLTMYLLLGVLYFLLFFLQLYLWKTFRLGYKPSPKSLGTDPVKMILLWPYIAFGEIVYSWKELIQELTHD